MTERGIGDLGKAIAAGLGKEVPGLDYAGEHIAQCIMASEDFKRALEARVEAEAHKWLDELGPDQDAYQDGYDAGSAWAYDLGHEAGATAMRRAMLDAGYALPPF